MAPERFDPRRVAGWEGSGFPVSTVAELVGQTLQPRQTASATERVLVLDTTDARRGFLEPRYPPIPVAEVGSTKKLARPGDVLVSRLRPYLQQVAYVDEGVPGLTGSVLACSTEFYVLRRRGEASIAFLVPFLLSPAVQTILAAAQEGGHHPRFSAATVMSLPVHGDLLAARDSISHDFEAALAQRRRAGATLDGLIAAVNRMLPCGDPSSPEAGAARGVAPVRPR